MQADVGLNVADLIVSLSGDDGFQITGYAAPFVERGQPDAVVRLKPGLAGPEAHRQVFDAEHFGWSAYRLDRDGQVVVYRPGRQMRIDLQVGGSRDRIDIFSGSPDRAWSVVDLLPLPAVSILAGHQGLLLHSCGLVWRSSGLIFAGVSGTGKSTMAGLWQDWGDARSSVVDDEHLMVRYRQGLARLYGVPWTRGDRQSRPGSVPLRAIFFLVQGPQNRCRALPPAEALARLMSQVFLPVWSREQMDQVLETSAHLVRDVQCLELEFLPRPETVYFLQDWLEDNL